MEKTWMSKTAGILDIIAGSLSVFSTLSLVAGVSVWLSYQTTGAKMEWVLALIIVLGIIRLLISVLAIIGGAYALKRRIWGLALAGSIAAVLSSLILGVVALIFTITGKKEFNSDTQPV